MIKKILSFLGLLKDWEEVYSTRSKWELYNKNDQVVRNEYSWYTILWSPSRSKYKMDIGGYLPKCHKDYGAMVETLRQLRLAESNIQETNNILTKGIKQ